MGKAEIDRAGVAKLLRDPALLREIKAEVGDAILADARAKAPVATGELRDSGFSEVSGDHVQVGFTAEHAPYVELGTVHMHARPYLRPAAVQDRGKLR